MKKSNFKKNDNINYKIIDVLCTEIWWLSEKNWRTDKNLQSTMIHWHPNATFNTILQTYKSKLIFIFTGKINLQKKIYTISTLNDQAVPDDNNLLTADSSSFTEVNLQNITSHMSTNEIKINCSKSFLKINPLNIPFQIIYLDNTSLRLSDIINDIEQELQQITNVIKEISWIIVFKKADININCDICVNVDLILVIMLR